MVTEMGGGIIGGWFAGRGFVNELDRAIDMTANVPHRSSCFFRLADDT